MQFPQNRTNVVEYPLTWHGACHYPYLLDFTRRHGENKKKSLSRRHGGTEKKEQAEKQCIT